ncbi:hypothetical protein [Pedobacter sp. SYSU D00535]|uniref:hypothetical protein n=1 Tax=Pedobacter sp. SYSU D00535 TaxID=2810308 RepID=UPI001A96D587|nr:hypothetical protein [Pedobacter sp. SYSU D00535]
MKVECKRTTTVPGLPTSEGNVDVKTQEILKQVQDDEERGDVRKSGGILAAALTRTTDG